jgi:hypothetical protein
MGRLRSAGRDVRFTYRDPCIERGSNVATTPPTRRRPGPVKEFLQTTLKVD